MIFADLPIEILEVLRARANEQGHELDITQDITTNKYGRGVTWELTIEGANFWCNILEDQKFSVFYEKYPRNNTNLVDIKIINYVNSNSCKTYYAKVNNKKVKITIEYLP